MMNNISFVPGEYYEEKKLEVLRAAIDAGDASPETEDLDGEKVFSRLRQKVCQSILPDPHLLDEKE